MQAPVEDIMFVDDTLKWLITWTYLLDYLVGKTDVKLDSKTMNRILEVQNLKQDMRDKIFDYIDLVIRDTKIRQAYTG